MFYLILWLAFTAVGALIGNSKGNPAGGAFWGLLLGPLGWLIISAVPDDRPRCPECLSVLVPRARKCRYCGSDQPDNPEATGLSVFKPTWGHAFGAGLFVLALFYIGALIAQINVVDRNAKATFESVARDMEAEPSHWANDSIKLSQYNRLSQGMSYREVRTIFGDPGTEVPHSRLEGLPDAMESVAYSWSNSDGSNALVIFLNGKLAKKSQAGLR
jgi:hypothetical protein